MVQDAGVRVKVGDRVRFSEVGREKVSAMPEAWGLHRALLAEEVGEVTEVEGEAVCVEFPSGGAHYWDLSCFEAVTDV